MADYFDDFDGGAGALVGRTQGGQTWASFGSSSGTPWQLTGTGGVVMGVDCFATAKVAVSDASITIGIAAPPATGSLRFGSSTDTYWDYQAYEGSPVVVLFDATTPTVSVQGTYSNSSAAPLPAAGPWELRIEVVPSTFQITIFCNDVEVLNWNDPFAWTESGIVLGSSTYLTGEGPVGSGDPLVVGFLRTGAAPPPVGLPFWTEFIGSREIL